MNNHCYVFNKNVFKVDVFYIFKYKGKSIHIFVQK